MKKSMKDLLDDARNGYSGLTMIQPYDKFRTSDYGYMPRIW